jgi:hypothetical protein
MKYFLTGVLLAIFCFGYTICQAAGVTVPASLSCPFDFGHASAPDVKGNATLPSTQQSAWVTRCWSTPRDGGGVFDEAIGPNRAGMFVTAWIANMGLIDATPGHEQGDWEMYVPHNGVTFNSAGYGFGLAFDGQHGGLVPTQDNEEVLGGPAFHWSHLYVTQVPCPRWIWGASACIPVNNGFVPIYE